MEAQSPAFISAESFRAASKALVKLSGMSIVPFSPDRDADLWTEGTEPFRQYKSPIRNCYERVSTGCSGLKKENGRQ